MINIEIKKSNKCNGEYSLFISFPYDQNIVNIIRNQIIRYWHPDEKQWEIPLKNLNSLKNELKDYDLNILDSNEILSNLEINR